MVNPRNLCLAHFTKEYISNIIGHIHKEIGEIRKHCRLYDHLSSYIQ